MHGKKGGCCPQCTMKTKTKPKAPKMPTKMPTKMMAAFEKTTKSPYYT